MNLESFSEGTLLQYGKESDLPVFIKFAPGDFDPELLNLLLEMKFSLVAKEHTKKAFELFSKNAMGRLLKMVTATPTVLKQIDGHREADKWGSENIFSTGTFKVYRYRNRALMIYSMRVKEWEMGARADFAKDDNKSAAKAIINRFLALSLAPIGVVGFWGKPQDKNLVVMKQVQSLGEVFFIDLIRQKVYTHDGLFTYSHFERLIKYENHLGMEKRKASREESIAFLSLATSWLDLDGLSTPIRQMIQKTAEIWDLFQLQLTAEKTETSQAKSALSPS